MAVPEIRARWEAAIAKATDQRALNIAKNVRSQDLKDKLAEASDNAAKHAVAEATQELDLRVMFLIDKSGSMEGAIEQSKETLSRILAGFAQEKLHIATFDTIGTVLTPKKASRAAVQHMLGGIQAGGGTIHAAAVRALHRSGVRVGSGEKLVVIVVGDEAGETGDQFARVFAECGYVVSALALMVSVQNVRGRSVKDAAGHLKVPFSEVNVESFNDPYQVPRVLKALLEAPVPVGSAGSTSGWVEKVMKTPLLKVAGR
jgi:hypothetical protein